METLYANIRSILASARHRAYTAVNYAMVESYWLIGQQIAENELQGATRAEYGKGVLKDLAERLTAEFGKGLMKATFVICDCFTGISQFVTHCVTN